MHLLIKHIQMFIQSFLSSTRFFGNTNHIIRRIYRYIPSADQDTKFTTLDTLGVFGEEHEVLCKTDTIVLTSLVTDYRWG